MAIAISMTMARDIAAKAWGGYGPRGYSPGWGFGPGWLRPSRGFSPGVGNGPGVTAQGATAHGATGLRKNLERVMES